MLRNKRLLGLLAVAMALAVVISGCAKTGAKGPELIRNARTEPPSLDPALATDNVSMDRVEFYLDDNLFAESTVPPYNVKWTIAMSDITPAAVPVITATLGLTGEVAIEIEEVEGEEGKEEPSGSPLRAFWPRPGITANWAPLYEASAILKRPVAGSWRPFAARVHLSSRTAQPLHKELKA